MLECPRYSEYMFKAAIAIALSISTVALAAPADASSNVIGKGCKVLAQPDAADYAAGMQFDRVSPFAGRLHIGSWTYGYAAQEDSDVTYNTARCVKLNTK